MIEEGGSSVSSFPLGGNSGNYFYTNAEIFGIIHSVLKIKTQQKGATHGTETNWPDKEAEVHSDGTTRYRNGS